MRLSILNKYNAESFRLAGLHWAIYSLRSPQTAMLSPQNQISHRCKPLRLRCLPVWRSGFAML